MAITDITGFPVEFAFFVTFACVWALLALGLNLQWGMTGLFNAGIAAFYAIGAYTTAILITAPAPAIPGVYPGHLGGFTQNWLLALPVSGLMAGVVGFLIAIPTLRLRTDYLAIATLGLGEVIRLFLLNDSPVTGGAIGIFFIPKMFANLTIAPEDWRRFLIAIFGVGIVAVVGSLGGIAAVRKRFASFAGAPRAWQAILVIALAAGTVAAAIGGFLVFARPPLSGNLAVPQGWQQVLIAVVAVVVVLATFFALEYFEHTPWARALKAIREDEDAAEVLGKDTFGFKLQSFVLGAAIMGMAGSVFTVFLVYIEPAQTFAPLVTFTVWAMLILGGTGNNKGAIIGAFLFYFMDWESSRIQIALSVTTGIPTVTPLMSQAASLLVAIFPFVVLNAILVVLILFWPRIRERERPVFVIALLSGTAAVIAGAIDLFFTFNGSAFPPRLEIVVEGVLLGGALVAVGCGFGIPLLRKRSHDSSEARPRSRNLRKRGLSLALWAVGEGILAWTLYFTFIHPDYLSNNISYFRLMLVGLLLIVFVVYRPQGLIPERLLTVRRRAQ